MSFREQILKELAGLEVTPKSIAQGLKEVFTGETVSSTYEPDERGNMVEKKRTVSRNPTDVLKGAMMYDALMGGDLGLAPAQLKKATANSEEIVHKRFEVDRRVIAYEHEDPIPAILEHRDDEKG